MVKLLILLGTLATSIVLSYSLHSEKDFIYIGSFKLKARTYGDFDENMYYFSVHPNTWPIALEDCRKIFGYSNTLVAIESVEEWEFLKHRLEKYGGKVYWTSGAYDPLTNKWRWAANNKTLPPFAPWDTGFPGKPNESLRVLVNATNRYDASWTTANISKTERYICEVQKSTIPTPCHESSDLVILLDSSENIGFDNFQKAEDFVNKLVSAFTGFKGNRIAIIVYSTTATTIIDLKNNYTPAEISEIILSTIFESGERIHTNLGIDLAVTQFNSSSRKVRRIMVILTSGTSENPHETVLSATKAVNMGIVTFSVGITKNIDEAELLAIAGGKIDHVFTTENFNELVELLASVSMAVC